MSGYPVRLSLNLATGASSGDGQVSGKQRQKTRKILEDFGSETQVQRVWQQGDGAMEDIHRL